MARAHHPGIALAAAVVIGTAPMTYAQTIYKCTAGAKVLYTAVPCDAGTVVVSPHQTPGPSAASPRPAPVPQPAATRPVTASQPVVLATNAPRPANALLRGLVFDAAALARACRDGDRRACDVRVCIETNDAGACARADGKLAGATWRELSRITQTLPQGPLAPPLALRGRSPIEAAVTIECLPGRLMRTVYLRPDLSTVFLRDSGSTGGSASPEPRYGARFDTVEAAATVACSDRDPVRP